jgi:hypothetical protein
MVTIAIVGLRAIGARALSNASSAGIKDGKPRSPAKPAAGLSK